MAFYSDTIRKFAVTCALEEGAEVGSLCAREVNVALRQVRILRHVDIAVPHH